METVSFIFIKSMNNDIIRIQIMAATLEFQPFY